MEVYKTNQIILFCAKILSEHVKQNSKIKIDLITFLNNLVIVPQEEQTNKNSDINNKGLKNNPECLLVIKKNEKVSRNERCPATGKKFKHCCGAL